MIVRELGAENDVKRHEVRWSVSGAKYATSMECPGENAGAEFLENMIERACKVGVGTFSKELSRMWRT